MKTICLIDGFNMYHSIRNLEKKFRWIDYYALCKHFLRKDDELEEVYYFTALAHWLKDAKKRHQVFIEACKIRGVRVVLGKFKEKTILCKRCRENFISHEEKATDVNIALYAYRLANKGVEQIFIVSGDTDLAPAIELIKQDFNTHIGIISPFKRHSKELIQKADISHSISINVMEQHLLPMEMLKKNGKKITCPQEWI